MNRIKRRVLAALLMVQALPAAGAVTLDGTRIVHEAAKGLDVTVRASNVGEQPALVQIWIDNGDGTLAPDQINTPFRLTPAEPRLLQAGHGQAFRVTYAPRPGDPLPPADRESVYYFNLLDIPPKPVDAGNINLLQFAVRTRVKLFHRPARLEGRPAQAGNAVQWSLAGRDLLLHNPTPYHVTLSEILPSPGAALQPVMLAPFETRAVALPAGAAEPSALSLTWLDDHGAPRTIQARPRQP